MLPPGYKDGTRLPAIFWFYPREFTNQEAFDQPDRTFNKNTFTNYGIRSMQFFVRQGYAVVVDSPALPIVGAQGQQNNNYVNDLRNDLSAVIDELDRRAIIDRNTARDRRAQLRRVHHGQRHGPHAVLQGRDRR